MVPYVPLTEPEEKRSEAKPYRSEAKRSDKKRLLISINVNTGEFLYMETHPVPIKGEVSLSSILFFLIKVMNINLNRKRGNG